ncbi:Uncharacterized protein GBIM_09933 [Gryllus bimaculatus]|nr:Uncharacterized protein GBIM_09933 [Gryllus bimaculatus]
MAEAEALKSMVMSFRVSELQMLLGFAGRNKSGRKTELQARAVELLRMRSTPVEMKIKELYKTIHQAHTTGATMQPSAPSAKDIPSVHSSSAMQQQSAPRSNVYNPGGYATDRPLPPPTTGMYASSIYHHPSYQHKTSPPVYSSYPVHPDVKLKRLPFFDLLGELLKPSTLAPQGSQSLQEGGFVFHLTPQQATDIGTSRELRPGCKMEYVIQVQMRFCLIESSCEQEDCYPQGIAVKVNGKVCPLPNPIPTNKPGVEPKRPPRPVNITHMVRLSPTVPNHVTVSWNVEYGKAYAVAIYLVRKLSSSELLQRLKQRGVRPPDYTRGLIKEKLQEDIDCEIATTSLRVSLMCPLGKMRMTTPCKATSCYHLQCFDASLYLQMNERKPTWMCPVCDKPAIFDNLVIDGYFQQVLDSGKLKDCNEVQLHQDGSWSSLIIKKEQTQELSLADKSLVKVELDDVVVIPEPKEQVIAEQPPPPPAPKKEPTVIDLTFSDSDDGSDSVKEVSLVKT